EAALALDRQVEILVPIAARLDMPARADDAQRERTVDSGGETRPVCRDLGVEVGLPGFAVVVAAVGEKADAEPSVGGAFELPCEVNGVGACFQPDAVLDDRLAAAEPPDRD